MCFGSVIVALLYSGVFNAWHLFVLLVFGGLLSLVSTRVNIPIVAWFLYRFEREGETFPGRGPIFFVFSALLVVQLFDMSIALASLMVLTLGDPIAHLVGKFFGRLKNVYTTAHKNIEGMLLGFIVAFLGAWLFVDPLLAFLGAFFGMFAEVIEFQLNKKHVDDNLIVPLVAATVMYIVRTYLI